MITLISCSNDVRRAFSSAATFYAALPATSASSLSTSSFPPISPASVTAQLATKTLPIPHIHIYL